ncbi:MazG-like family protein [Candidatus Formimonas warabiya]|uniref:MazG-like family protein n=1 Tax=Formimonas warabiya TaxID=1761012 RepID=A0A3G1KUZ6_FORW1|nr:MazG-like family protein [Candidatus Formimonas warabiya]ATW26230.1 hypothetical protein DCMF_16980 [Candidatus Formimonas warabiya]
MHSNTRDVDIAKNLKVIEWLKAELVSSVAALLRAMVKGSEGLILDCITGIIITTYVLGKRLGIPFSRIDLNVKARLQDSAMKEHEVEKWFGDITGLRHYVEENRR